MQVGSDKIAIHTLVCSKRPLSGNRCWDCSIGYGACFGLAFSCVAHEGAPCGMAAAATLVGRGEACAWGAALGKLALARRNRHSGACFSTMEGTGVCRGAEGKGKVRAKGSRPFGYGHLPAHAQVYYLGSVYLRCRR